MRPLSTTRTDLPALRAWLGAAVIILIATAPGILSAQTSGKDGPAEKAQGSPPVEPGQSSQGQGGPVKPLSPTDLVQLSFSGANIDVVVKWLAEVTGKSIVKHKQVNCQLTILSSKKIPLKEALGLVYRSLAMEGFSVVETNGFIVIIPEAMDLKFGVEMIDAGEEGPAGKQFVVKLFPIQHTQAGRLKDKIRGVLSEKAKVEVDERANKIIVSDYADNIRLLGELLRELDVTTISDMVIEIIPLKYAEAEQLATILNQVFADSAPRGVQPQQPGGQPPQPGGQPQPGAPQAPSLDQVRILADKVSNRLIVMAPQKKLQDIKELVQSLDQEKPADIAVRVITLQHVNAKDLAQELAPLYQKMRGGASKDVLEITADQRSNTLIILSSEANHKALQILVTSLDTEEAQENTMKAFSLKNADAEDVAEQLSDLHQKSSGNSYWDDYSPYSSRGRNRSRGEVRFVADRRRNTVIAIGPPSALQGIESMVKTLDEPVEGENLVPRIFPLKYVSALDLEEVLNELFLKKTDRRQYWDYNAQDTQKDIGRLYGKVRIASEPYTNSLIVTTNSPENFAAVETVLKQLDAPSEASATTLNVPLKFAKAITMANNINILFAQGGSPLRRQAQQDGQPRQPQNRQGQGTQATSFELEDEIVEESFYPWLGGAQEGQRTQDGRTTRPVSDLVGKVRVVPDMRTNSLLISTNSHNFPQVLKVVNDLDIPTPQVLIEATIIEVSGDLRRRLGTRWSPDGAKSFDSDDLDNSVIASTKTTIKNVFMGSALPNSMRSGILDATLDLDILVQFLVKNLDSRVRAEPRINVADNERGKLFVGSRVPFISGSLNTPEGGRSDSFQYIDVGIILEVTPHINNDDQVALKVRVEASQIRPGITLFGGAIVDTRNYRTDLSVKSGQTLILGGIIQQEESEVIRKVPFLGDIPILGWLFKKKDTEKRDVELMVFLKPTVTQSPKDVERLMREEKARAPSIHKWEQEIEEQRRVLRKELDAEQGKEAGDAPKESEAPVQPGPGEGQKSGTDAGAKTKTGTAGASRPVDGS